MLLGLEWGRQILPASDVYGNDAKDDRRTTKQKIKEEKEAGRRWQDPYERKITLEGLMDEGLEYTM